ncbi:uncharacterized protein LOC129741625 [Uranotaenia lowii]|uniref:uncharacterized protein LOC129741625 n=1 Tax=Uranotaenia lowii TaxID=190385 RepID=UPI0024791D4E|nr:uncharacterized protein LOC129741625 [Uranotaenia lowii]
MSTDSQSTAQLFAEFFKTNYQTTEASGRIMMPIDPVIHDICLTLEEIEAGLKRLDAAVENRISPHQHGFFSKRSVVTNLCEFTTRVLDWMIKGFQVDCIYTDMSKAFDVAGINEILDASARIGIGGNILPWIESYLVNRQQYVSKFCLLGAL